jgi:hypothetical protein
MTGWASSLHFGSGGRDLVAERARAAEAAELVGHAQAIAVDLVAALDARSRKSLAAAPSETGLRDRSPR